MGCRGPAGVQGDLESVEDRHVASGEVWLEVGHPALIVADRIDAIHAQLEREGLAGQFHPSYTRMVPAHYVVELQLIGCPDPDPTYTRFFAPERNALPADLNEIGRRYIGALAEEIIADGSHIKVTVNGTLIVDADLSKIDKTPDHQKHPGLHNAKGYVGWLGHGDPVAFRNVRIKELP